MSCPNCKKNKCNCPEPIQGPMGPTGPQGPQGEVGNMPDHEWNGTQIRFRNPDGSWSEALNMGKEINTGAGENCPQVSPDGKYFFFNRYNPDLKMGNMYWMDAKIIENLKPEELK